MPIVMLRSSQRFVGDPPGPYSRSPGRRRLRVLLDVPRVEPEENQAGLHDGVLSVPDEMAFLMALMKWDDIEPYWIESVPSMRDPGSVHLDAQDVQRRVWPFTAHLVDGSPSRRGFTITDAMAAAVETEPASPEVVVALARELETDFIVTARPSLLGSSVRDVVDANPIDVRTAVAMIGLRLRLVDNYAVSGPVARFTFSRQMFFWSGAHQFDSAGARFGRSLFSYSREVGADNSWYLASAYIYRLTRVLHQRDVLHCALLSEKEDEEHDGVFEAFDYVMINLVAASDVLARITHLTLNLPPKDIRRAGWQNPQWLALVRGAEPDLAQVLEPDSIGAKVLRACVILRNTVHGEPPRGMNVFPAHRGTHTHIGLSTEELRKLRILLGPDEELGSWGWYPRFEETDEHPYPSMHMVSPGVLVERLVPIALETMSALRDRIPVERLPGVDLELLAEPVRGTPELGHGGRARTSLLFGLAPNEMRETS